VPSPSTRGRLPLPRVPCPWHSGKGLFPECLVSGTRGNIFVFLFFCPIFLWGLQTLFKTPCPNLAYFWFFCYISLVFPFSWILGTLQIWTTGTSNHIIWWFKKWYSWYLVYIEALSNNSHEMLSMLLSWHDEQLTGKVVLNYRKSGRTPKITKLDGASCYHMYRLCARIENISRKLGRRVPKTHTFSGVLSYWSYMEMSGS
jgi:hypothetical protein